MYYNVRHAGILLNFKKQTTTVVRIANNEMIMTTKTAIDTGKEESFVDTNIMFMQHK